MPDNITKNPISLQDGYFDLKGLAVYSTLGVSTLRAYIWGGKLPAFKIKGKVLVRRSEFDSWIEAHRVKKKQDINKLANEAIESLKRA